MPIDPDARQRLVDLMDERRLELGLTWRELCDQAGISYETIRNFRSGSGALRPLTQRHLSAALQWEHGEVARILAGASPDPADARPQIVRDHWDEPEVRHIWQAPGISAEAREGMITIYLRDTGKLPGENDCDANPGAGR